MEIRESPKVIYSATYFVHNEIETQTIITVKGQQSVRAKLRFELSLLSEKETEKHLVKIPMAFFVEIEKNSKIHTESQKTSNSQRKKYKAGGITNADSKLYYKAMVKKAVWYWHRNRHMGRWN